jgi:hypothetical protein
MLLARLLAENAELRGDTVADVCAELERVWLEFAFVHEGENA